MTAYFVAIGATAAAVLLRWALDPWIGNTVPFSTIYGAIALAVWYGGYRPAIVATALGYFASNYLFIEPRGTFAIEQIGDHLALGLFVFTCSLIIAFGEAVRRAQRQATEERELLRVTFASIGDAVITTDTYARITYVNAVAEGVTGWTQQEAVGQPLDAVFRIVNEKTRKEVENPATRALKEGIIVGLANHTILIRKDETERPIDDSAAPIRDELGHIIGCVLVFRDVTESRQAERAARSLASIVESSDDAIIGKDINGVITSWNHAAERLYGYSSSEAIGQSVAILAPPEQADEMPAILARLKQGEKIEHFDTVRRAKNGRLVPISLTVSPIKDEDGEIVGASKVARDISERKRAAETLYEERERLRVTLSSIGDGVITTDVEGCIAYLNPVAESLTGWTNTEAARRPLEEVFHIVNEETRQPVENPVTKALREGTIVGLANHTILITKDGSERPIDDSAAPIRNEQGHVLGCVLVFRDVAEKREQAKKLEASEQQLAAELQAITRLHALSARLLIADNLSNALEDVLENAIQTSGADFGNIQLYNPQVEALEIVAQQGFDDDFLDYFRHVRVDDDSVCAQAMQDGQRIIIEDVELDPGYEPHRRFAAAAGYRAVQSTPLKSRTGSIPGMLSTHFRLPQRVSERNQRLLDLYARHAADLIDRLRSEETLREQAELLNLAHDAIMVRSTEGVIAFWSDGAEQMYGWPRAAVLGRLKHTLLKTEFPRPLPEIEAELAERGWWEGILTHTRHDGNRIVVASRWALRQSEPGKPSVVLEINNDITEQRRAEQTLADKEARIRSVLDHVLDGIIAIDENGVVEAFNPAAERLFGYRDTEVVGRNIKMLMPDPFHSEHDGYLANYRSTGQAKIIGIGREVEGRRKDGSTFPMDLAVTEYWLGERRYFTGIVRDITQRKRIEKEMYDLLLELKDADRRKDEFLATLAHELRGPLAPLRNTVEIMKHADGNGDLLQQARDTMERQLGQMVRLVDDLLDVSRITRNKLELRLERVELASVIHHVVEMCRPLIEQSKHEPTVTLPPEPIYLNADPVRLAQVFSNLLNNACKYTEPGGHITLTAERQGSDVVVTVQDNGTGIPPDMLPYVFEMFTQVDRHLERSQGGLGIGLTLVQQLVTMHGGMVNALSEGLGRGSTFVVRLPILIESAKGAHVPAIVKAPTIARRFLVVDDNKDSAMSLATLLKIIGNQTHMAHDGLEAVKAAEKFRPEVILLDIGLPKLNGHDACRRIREQPWGKNMVLVALTGWGQDDDRRKSKDAGFNHHMVKPVDLTNLMKLLAESQHEPI